MSNNLTITVENYWNERLEKVEIFYHNSDLPNNNAFVFFDLESRQSSTTVDSVYFLYQPEVKAHGKLELALNQVLFGAAVIFYYAKLILMIIILLQLVLMEILKI
ncbi:hypothetical protein [Providencia sp. PROV130]|uniref:hypothetical protein n=1 Tax=Providencia sp. PROV130 TaxID=2949840 RepID=UPI00234A5ABA|nr:hypothetical protein [Providencia sp. PROV130]